MSAYDTVILADSPVSYWPLADPSGTTATDSGDSNPGTYSGGFTLAQSAAAGLDGSVLFNGTSGIVTVPNASNLRPTTAISIEAWVNPASVSSIAEFLCKPYTTNGTTAPYIDYALSSGRNNAGHFALLLGIAGTYHELDGGTSASTGKWYHVVGVYDGAHMFLYVNGISDATPAAVTGSVGANSQPLYFGNAGAWSEYFHGNMAAPAVYNYALTAAQIRSHYFAGIVFSFAASAPSKPSSVVLQSAWSPSLAGAYMAEENTGTTTADFSGNGNTGTFHGGMTWSAQPTGPGLLAVDDGTSPGCYCGVGTLGFSGITAITFSAYCALNTYGDAPGATNLRVLMGASRASASYPQCAISYNASAQAIEFNARYNDFANVVAPAPPLNTYVLITGRITSGGEQSLWYNGVKIAAQTISWTYATDAADQSAIGGQYIVPGDNWSGPIACAYFVKLGFTDAQIMALAADPFAPGRQLGSPFRGPAMDGLSGGGQFYANPAAGV